MCVCVGFDSVESAKKSTDQKHREQSQRFGVFRAIWPDTPVFLNNHRAAILRGIHICSDGGDDGGGDGDGGDDGDGNGGGDGDSDGGDGGGGDGDGLVVMMVMAMVVMLK